MTRRFGPAARSATERRDLHAELTQKIVAEIEACAGEFKMPWHRPGVAFTLPVNALTGVRYRGSNILWLWMSADASKFEHQVWATFRQWKEMSGQVRGGEKGTMIVKYGEWTPRQDAGADAKAAAAGRTNDASDDDSSDGSDKRLYAKAAHVFNIDQVDAPVELRTKLLPASAPRPDLTVRMAHVDAFLSNTKAEFREGGTRAFYRHRTSDGEGDYIQMPPRNLFTGTETSTPTESYESTRLHEVGHWAHAPHRMSLEMSKRFGDETYAVNELIAELTAAFLCAELQVTNVPRPDHAQYIAGWLKALKNDSKAIFAAASSASRTVDYLMALQPDRAPVPSTAGSDSPSPGGVACP